MSSQRGKTNHCLGWFTSTSGVSINACRLVLKLGTETRPQNIPATEQLKKLGKVNNPWCTTCLVWSLERGWQLAIGCGVGMEDDSAGRKVGPLLRGIREQMVERLTTIAIWGIQFDFSGD